jgi:MOSC domain-containing protein YiiM
MNILSVNVGRPQTLPWQGKAITTSIFKSPVNGPVHVAKVNLSGDEQADLRVHGGVNKAVYAYDQEHYEFWKTELGLNTLEPGAFGENLTTVGLLDHNVRLGDQFRMGSAVLMAVQPRFPCVKLGLRFNDPRMTKRFAKALRHGIYFRVVEEGNLQAGDTIELVNPSDVPATIQDVVNAFYGLENDLTKLEVMTQFSGLPRYVREALKKQMTSMQQASSR